MKIGYMRVSTKLQDHALQHDALIAAGIDPANIYKDVITGKTTTRAGLDACLARLETGDTLYVWKLDRLGRTVLHLAATIDDFRKHGIGFVSLTEGFDVSTTMGKAMMGMMAVFAEMERCTISERTKAGMAAVKSRGIRLGRPTVYHARYGEIKNMLDNGATVRDVARQTGVSKSQVSKIGRQTR